MEKFVLPKRWCVKITNENINILNKYRSEKISIDLDFAYSYMRYDGYGDISLRSSECELITFEQFKKYVMKEKFVLPEKWCIKITQEVQDLYKTLDTEKLNFKWPQNYIFTLNAYYGLSKKNHFGDYEIKEGFIEITFEQFKEYVLNESEIREDYSYILKLINKLKNKTICQD